MASFSKRSLCLLLLLLDVSSGIATEENESSAMMEGRFQRWKAEYKKTYATLAEERHRLQVYTSNVRYIEAANAAGRLTYELGETSYTDVTSSEFMAMRRTSPPPPLLNKDAAATIIASHVVPIVDDAGRQVYLNESAGAAASVDWRASGAVTPVKMQSLGASWPFSVVGALEGMHKIKHGNLVSLSVQQLADCVHCVDCSRGRGMDGGWMHEAFQWIRSNSGIANQASYPYRGGRAGTCNPASLPAAATITGYSSVATRSEVSLQNAVANHPVAAAIHATGLDDIHHYKSGVYNGPCRGGDHGHEHVTVVGYGVNQTSGDKYWIVKTSLGPQWGMNGYILLKRDMRHRPSRLLPTHVRI